MTEPASYPAMSHPTADPAVNAVTARLVGLQSADPARARILELGCGSGHHLLPLAARWPEAELVGIDRDAAAIGLARELAAEAGLANIDFRPGDLEHDHGAGPGSWDFIIAHGVFSWVPDAVKLALLRSIAASLAPNGVAVVCFNVAAGWRARLRLVAKARAIQCAGEGGDVMRALELLREVCVTDAERVIVDDMRAKGAAVLAHDDFAPVCDAFSLSDFVALAAHHGLRWLGEGVPAENQPVGGAVVDPAAYAGDPVAMHDALDEAAGRTFRSALLCREGACIEPRVSAAVVSGFHLSPCKDAVVGFGDLFDGKTEVTGGELIGRHGPAVATRLVRGIFDGSLAARTHPAPGRTTVPEHPRMDELRLACARRRLPVVDARHRPCVFPESHAGLLALMDGTRRIDELADLAKARCPELAFAPWMRHLAERGLFG